jgi:pilus assembly protein CpaC
MLRRLAAASTTVALFLAYAGSAHAQRRPHSPTADVKPTQAQTVEITLTVGDNKTIPASDVASYSLGTPGIVDVKVTPDMSQFVFVGLRPGSTTVLMLKRGGAEVTYAITVYARPPEIVKGELEQLLQGYTGLKLRSVGPRFFIEGGVSTEADAKRIGLIASLYPGQVESLVVVGSVGQEHTINVRIDFYFVQYDKSSSYGVGLAWPARFGGQSAFNGTWDITNKTGTATLTAAQALPALDLAQNKGWAKVLKHSVVVTTSGSEATFENGGEQNFSVANGITSSIQAIKFGTNVTVNPRYDLDKKELEVKVNANVADLTAPGAGSLPGRSTSAINTFVHLKLGQSLVLSGIKTKREVHGVNGLPGLSQIPVLGLLFGSHSNDESEVEGAVFIIPSVVDSQPRRAHDIVDVAMKQFEDYSGKIENVQTFNAAPPNYN